MLDRDYRQGFEIRSEPDPTDEEMGQVEEIWATFRRREREGAISPLEGFVFLIGLMTIGGFLLWLIWEVLRLLWLVWEATK